MTATLEKYTFGVGDRFAHQAVAQLAAFDQLAATGVIVVPVWNKSNREHTFVGSEPQSVYDAAAAAIHERRWAHGWHVDADHIRLETVDRFLSCSDFFTIDVADSIGQPPSEADLAAFVDRHPELIGISNIAGLAEPIVLTRDNVAAIARKYLQATQEAGRIDRHIRQHKPDGAPVFIEVSMDETDQPQTPPELLVILAMLADEQIPLQTIAPKFTGRFNKGVDYVGDLAQFEREFSDDLAVLAHAVSAYGFPAGLKLSVHSGSDKFSLYPILRRQLARTGAGLHLKTAGTTWLEELIGLAEAGGDGLAMVQQIYSYALDHVDELRAPYAAVINVDRARLPSVATFNSWSGADVASALRHIPQHPQFQADLRQLLHVSFKVAAKQGPAYLDLLKKHADVVGRNVTENLYDRHLRPLFAAE